jgi:hypothetical protein
MRSLGSFPNELRIVTYTYAIELDHKRSPSGSACEGFSPATRGGHEHPVISALYDQRVLHVLKKSVASYVEAGVRFDVYGLDYGCYVELTTTQRAPEGLFEVEEEDGTVHYVEVPQDDYRSIRRAILDVTRFDAAVASGAIPVGSSVAEVAPATPGFHA